MTNPVTSDKKSSYYGFKSEIFLFSSRTDTSFWLKFLHDSDLSVNNSTLQQYSVALASQFTTIEEFLSVDENELINLGLTNPFDRAYLIKQARLLDDKENHQLPLMRLSAGSNRVIEPWLGHNQSTPLNPKSKCNLSPALLSRISFNDHPISIISPSDELRNIIKKCDLEHMIETPERIMSIGNNEKIKTQKKTPPTSNHGMRTIKSLSDTISLQKKIVVGSERLKRLALTRSLFKRQTALITKKVTNIKNKFINPFAKSKNKIDPTSMNNITITPRRTTGSSSIKQEREPKERRKIQALSLNNDIRRSTDLISQQEDGELKHTVQTVQTLASKRFKLGATTSFLTRSLANHNHIE